MVSRRNIIPRQILDEKGRLIERGFATKMVFAYNRTNVRSWPLRLKEWNFYQLMADSKVVQMTIGHVSYVCSVTLTVFDTATGKKDSISSMKLMYVPKLDLDPERDSAIMYQSQDFMMAFKVLGDRRLLSFKGRNEQYQNVEAELTIDNSFMNDKMCIATPFKNPRHFYLNYKENFYRADGYVLFDQERTEFKRASGLIDWGRGVWPFTHQWYWGSLSSYIEGAPFGLNIGWGFGAPDGATENIFFYRRVGYKLGHLKVERDKKDYMRPWKLVDDQGLIELRFEPFFDNFTHTNMIVVNTRCHQIYGRYSGYILIDDEKIEFADLVGFIEHAINHW